MKTNSLQLTKPSLSTLIVLLLIVAGMTKVFAQNFTVGDLNYSVNSDGTTVTITGHVDGTSASGTLTIPPSISYEGSLYTVSAIGGSAFSNCSGFSGDLIIPNSVTTIGSSAFWGCTGFTGVLQIGSSMTSIESETFSSCSGFSSLTLPNSITEIGSFAFYGCSSLSSFNIPNSVEVIKGEAFNNTGWYNNQPDGVLYLDGWCLGFKGDPSEYESIIIQEGTMHISDAAFTNCRELISVVLPNSLVYISEMAFEGCEHLKHCPCGASSWCHFCRLDGEWRIGVNGNGL